MFAVGLRARERSVQQREQSCRESVSAATRRHCSYHDPPCKENKIKAPGQRQEEGKDTTTGSVEGEARRGNTRRGGGVVVAQCTRRRCWVWPETRYISVDSAALFNLQLGPVDCARNAITTVWNPFSLAVLRSDNVFTPGRHRQDFNANARIIINPPRTATNQPYLREFIFVLLSFFPVFKTRDCNVTAPPVTMRNCRQFKLC